jgi:hypothetical protein
MDFGGFLTSSSSGHQFNGNNNNNNWNGQGRFYGSFAGFSKILQNMDMDQLTSLVTNGIEAYKKYSDKS